MDARIDGGPGRAVPSHPCKQPTSVSCTQRVNAAPGEPRTPRRHRASDRLSVQGERAPARQAALPPGARPDPRRRRPGTRAARWRRLNLLWTAAFPPRRTAPARRVRSPLPVAPRRCRFTGRTEPIDHAPVRADRQLGTDTNPPRGFSRQPAHRRGEPFTGRPRAAPRHIARAGCVVNGLRRPPGARRQRGRGGFYGRAVVRRVCGHVARRLAYQRADVCNELLAIEPHAAPPAAELSRPPLALPTRSNNHGPRRTGHGPWHSRPTSRQPAPPL